MSHSRILNVSNSFGFGVGTIPFLYLGVPIFKEKPKAIYFQPRVDRIKIKLATIFTILSGLYQEIYNKISRH